MNLQVGLGLIVSSWVLGRSTVLGTYVATVLTYKSKMAALIRAVLVIAC